MYNSLLRSTNEEKQELPHTSVEWDRETVALAADGISETYMYMSVQTATETYSVHKERISPGHKIK